MATALSALERAARAAFSTYIDIERGDRLTWEDLDASAQWAWMAVADAAVKAYQPPPLWEVYNLDTRVTCKEERDGALAPMHYDNVDAALDRARSLNRFAVQVGVRPVGG